MDCGMAGGLATRKGQRILLIDGRLSKHIWLRILLLFLFLLLFLLLPHLLKAAHQIC